VRLFVAIVPPPAALAELAAAVSPLRLARPELRWNGPADWHLTLAFLGEVADRVLPDLSVRLERAARRHPVTELAVHGAGAFPRPSRASVLWAGIAQPANGQPGDGQPGDAQPGNGRPRKARPRSGLAPLAASVAAGARRAGAPPPDEGRRYRPHLTLARCREPAEVTAITAALADLRGRPWTATEIRLIRSNLGGRAPRYEDLGRWPLRTPG
jgi:2'-5' RNA ligase